MIQSSVALLRATDLERDSVRVLKTGHKDNQQFYRTVDPWTWGWVAIEICEGIISGVAANIAVGWIFGDSISGKLNNFLSSFNAVIRTAIAENEVRRLIALAESTRRLWLQQQNSPDPVLLTLLQKESSDLASEAKTLGLRATPAFAIFASIHLAVLKQRHVASGAPGDWANVQGAAAEMASYVPAYGEWLSGLNESRAGQCYLVEEAIDPVEHGHHGGPISFNPNGSVRTIHGRRLYWAFRFDGSEIRLCDPDNSREAAEGIRRTWIDRDTARLEAELLGPLWAARDKWVEISRLP